MSRSQSIEPLTYLVVDEGLHTVGSGRDTRPLTTGEKLVQAAADWRELLPECKFSIMRVPDTGVVPRV